MPPPSPRVAWMASPDDAEARRCAALVGAPVVPVSAREVRRARAEVVHVRLPVEDLARAAFVCTLGGAAAVVVTPIGSAVTLPWWERRFHRFVLPTQAAAHEWRRTGVALGRLVVLPESPAQPEGFAALYAEVAAMGRRPALWGR